MDKHPEQRPDEEYLGNTTGIKDYQRGLKTLRLGIMPYDIEGNPIISKHYANFKPLFISKEEYNAYYKVMVNEMRKATTS